MSQHPDREKPRVLLVDDDDGLREVMVSVLRGAGFAVTAVATGAEAIAAAPLVKPRAAVIDILLPDAGGPGLAEVLRRDLGQKSLPVLFTTALGLQPVKSLLPKVAVLFKPFSRDELVARVWRMVSGPAADAA
jgi:two-component system OmpR family response regulator